MVGAINNVGSESFIAYGSSLAADTPTIIGTGSGTLVLPPDAGTQLEVTSTDPLNADAVIKLDMLDADFKPVSATVLVTGAGVFPVVDEQGTPVVAARLNAAANIGPRNGGEVVTAITIHQAGAPAVIYGDIKPEAQEMQRAVFTVPAGQAWAVSSIIANMTKDPGTESAVSLWLRIGAPGKALRRAFPFGMHRSGASNLDFINSELERLDGPYDIVVEATSTTADVAVGVRVTIRTARA